MTIRLYVDYISQPSRAVLAFCIINKIDVRIHEIRIAKMQHLDEEYQKINPMKKVPAIYDEENKLSLGESHAIIVYLIQKYKLSSSVYPKEDIILQAKVNQYLHYHHQNTRKCALLVYTNIFSKLYPVDNKVKLDPLALQQEIEDILTFIELHYFRQSEFMIGKELTVADLSAYYEILMLELVGWRWVKWAKMDAWMKKMSSIGGVREANKGYLKMVPKMKQISSSL